MCRGHGRRLCCPGRCGMGPRSAASAPRRCGRAAMEPLPSRPGSAPTACLSPRFLMIMHGECAWPVSERAPACGAQHGRPNTASPRTCTSTRGREAGLKPRFAVPWVCQAPVTQAADPATSLAANVPVKRRRKGLLKAVKSIGRRHPLRRRLAPICSTTPPRRLAPGVRAPATRARRPGGVGRATSVGPCQSLIAASQNIGSVGMAIRPQRQLRYFPPPISTPVPTAPV